MECENMGITVFFFFIGEVHCISVYVQLEV